VNYPNEYEYTRITEFKYLSGQEHPKTSIVYEFPRAEGDPYYPIPKPDCRDLYKKYKALADDTPGVYFVGRLATYQYYNMDQVTAQALAMFKRIVTGHTATVAGATAAAPPPSPRSIVRPALPTEVIAPARAPSIAAPTSGIGSDGRLNSVLNAGTSGAMGMSTTSVSDSGANLSGSDYASTRSTPKNGKLR
jgi:hypothetical protein